jgi:hypothetical protein
MLLQLRNLVAYAPLDGVALLDAVIVNLDWRGHAVALFPCA